MSPVVKRLLEIRDELIQAVPSAEVLELAQAAAQLVVAEQVAQLNHDLVAGEGRIVVTIENTDYPIGIRVTNQ